MTERASFIMDELVDTQIACRLQRGGNLYSEYTWVRTPLMNQLIAFTAGPCTSSHPAAVRARKLMWALGVGIFCLTFVASFRIGDLRTAVISVTLPGGMAWVTPAWR